jgi:hypothetical protein
MVPVEYKSNRLVFESRWYLYGGRCDLANGWTMQMVSQQIKFLEILFNFLKITISYCLLVVDMG